MFHDPRRAFLPAARRTTKYLEITAPGCFNTFNRLAIAFRFIIIYAARKSSNRELSLRVYRPELRPAKLKGAGRSKACEGHFCCFRSVVLVSDHGTAALNKFSGGGRKRCRRGLLVSDATVC
jgi:hypothetical protein